MNVEKAIARAKECGLKVKKKDIAARLWPNSSEVAQQVNMTSLLNGTTRKVEPEWVKIICEMTGVDPNFLFDDEEV